MPTLFDFGPILRPVDRTRHAAQNNRDVPNYEDLTMEDIKEFALAYMRNEYSPKPLEHGPLLHPKNQPYNSNARFLSTTTASPYEPLGRTMPAQASRWMATGSALRQYNPLTNLPSAAATSTANRTQRQGFRDASKFRNLLQRARVPLDAIEQLEATLKDFSRLNRFSRVRTKLARAGAFAAFAARLINDQSLLAVLWHPAPPRCTTTGFAMPADAVEVARRDMQEAAAATFVRLGSKDNFELRCRALLKTRLPGKRLLGEGFRVDGQRLEAYRDAENPRAATWRHVHREYFAIEDLRDVGQGERLVRRVSFTRECNDCGVRHQHEIQLIIGPEEEMPRQGELPAYHDLVPLPPPAAAPQEQEEERLVLPELPASGYVSGSGSESEVEELMPRPLNIRRRWPLE
ncbi:uncharacterized protein LTHEOB_8425 [Lasiodiplodia theobromae]|uniref:uncharacterized protein n=1 Tax=Lasiodiplodia theobromae TaxID=45133 RepID=UPI0015C327D1|nr:uncharacterized protein LTHEOB_8425 [Lasiodiplodia theobromae]KAF4541844.1 hypothetical protein LTHEOB_8425 [Lasiodiplodia theobromae]